MTDQILLYRDNDLLSTSSINISELLIDSKVLNQYSLFRIPPAYNFYTGNTYNVPFTESDINELGIVQNGPQTTFELQEEGVYEISYTISCTNSSDSSCYFRLCINSPSIPVILQLIKLGQNNISSTIVLTLNQYDLLFIECESGVAGGSSLLVSMDKSCYMIIKKLR